MQCRLELEVGLNLYVIWAGAPHMYLSIDHALNYIVFPSIKILSDYFDGVKSSSGYL